MPRQSQRIKECAKDLHMANEPSIINLNYHSPSVLANGWPCMGKNVANYNKKNLRSFLSYSQILVFAFDYMAWSIFEVGIE